MKNTFSVLQEENTEPLLEEEEPPPFVKIDRDDKKIFIGKERGRIRKAQIWWGSIMKAEKNKVLKNIYNRDY